MTVPASPPPRRRQQTLPGVGPSEPSTFVDQAVVDAANALTKVDAMAGIISQLQSKKNGWIALILLLSGSTTAERLYDRLTRDPERDAIIAMKADVASSKESLKDLTVETKSLRITTDALKVKVEAIQREQDRQAGAAMQRQESIRAARDGTPE